MMEELQNQIQNILSVSSHVMSCLASCIKRTILERTFHQDMITKHDMILTEKSCNDFKNW
jgi:hypothetical protein